MASTKIQQNPEHFKWRGFILLFSLILLSYSNTFTVPFHLDDFHNIIQNPKLHITDVYPKTIYDALIKNSAKSRIFYRPVSNMTFALNWYFSEKAVLGYHIVNITVHFLTAIFLYLTFLALLNTPNIEGLYRGNEHFIALLAVCLWAINPIQTQAVTYIVQRMASMAAMFYVIGIYFYINARISVSFKKKLFLFSGVLVSFLLSVGSKENAMMLPISLFILEVLFFQKMAESGVRKKIVYFGIIIITTIVLLGLFLFLNGDFVKNIQEGYEKRTFSLFERLITQPRIVLFYLSQIFYPIADRLSIDHDIQVSIGLFSPWTTLPAIMAIICLLCTAFWQMNKRPLLAFAIFFFFINHIIESSFIPLEMVFEHRNYLPSLFLFLPVAAGLKWLIDYYASYKKVMKGLLIGFITLLIFMLGFGTYIRNMVWKNGKILWEDTIAKAPGRARGYQNLASVYYESIKDYERMMELSEKAMHLDDSSRHKAKFISFFNMANIYLYQKKDYEKAIELYNRILDIQPENPSVRYRLVMVLIKKGQLTEAMAHIDQLLLEEPDLTAYLNTKAFLLLKEEHPENALTYLIKAIKNSPDDERTLLNIGLAKSLTGKYLSAEHYYKRIHPRSEKINIAMFLLIENSIKAQNILKAETYAEQLLSITNIATIQNTLNQLNERDLLSHDSIGLITQVISNVMIKKAQHLFSEVSKKDDSQ
jgi:protein O-mannosyl-transferase